MHLSKREAYKHGFIPKSEMNPKFFNQKVDCGDHHHDSLKEQQYCSELMIRKRSGEIAGFDVQVTFELQEGFRMDNGERIQSIRYIADFVVDLGNGVREIVDVKADNKFQSAEFRLKFKMLKFKLKDSRQYDYLFTIA
jgi:hypothetical protein